MAAGNSLAKRVIRRLTGRRPTSQELWQWKWATRGHEGSQAPRGLDRLPTVIESAIESGWFRSGTSLLDIGCGAGDMAAMLAARGFDTLGIDFAPAAIELARESHLGHEPITSLRFEVADLATDTTGLGVFENLVDRGCFHCLDVSDHGAYGRNVAAMSAPGARFLMICGLGAVSAATREKHVRAALEEFFVLESVDDGGGADGLALWMIRR